MNRLLYLLGISALSLSLGGCAHQEHNEHHDDHARSEVVEHSKHHSDDFDNGTLYLKNASFKMTPQKVMMNDNQSGLQLNFAVHNCDNQQANDLMNDKLISAYQEINGKEEKLALIDNLFQSQQSDVDDDGHQNKKDSAQAMLTYQLKDPNAPVKVVAYNLDGHEIGSEMLDLAKLKQVNANQNSQSMNVQISSSIQSLNPQNNQQHHDEIHEYHA